MLFVALLTDACKAVVAYGIKVGSMFPVLKAKADSLRLALNTRFNRYV